MKRFVVGLVTIAILAACTLRVEAYTVGPPNGGDRCAGSYASVGQTLAAAGNQPLAIVNIAQVQKGSGPTLSVVGWVYKVSGGTNWFQSAQTGVADPDALTFTVVHPIPNIVFTGKSASVSMPGGVSGTARGCFLYDWVGPNDLATPTN